jgi:hypothetical protein
MPSPFPGMDPFLESPHYFPMLHGNMITYLQEFLQAALPEPYDAATNERTWIEYAGRAVIPDVNVLAPREHRKRPAPQANGGTAVAAVREAPRSVVIRVAEEELRESFLEIHVRKGSKLRLVTCIELLSPTNKSPGHKVRKAYRKKQRECLGSRVHLVEIDLLRDGQHTTAIPEARLEESLLEFDYHVCIHHFHQAAEFLVFPIRMEDPLPEIPIPLLPEDGAIKVDLQAVFNRCYDVGPYRKRIDYRREKPDVPLTRKQAAWAKGITSAHP